MGKIILNQQYDESILDPIKDELNPDIFDNEKMKKSVADAIMNNFQKWARIMLPKAKIERMTMIGSSAGYQYTHTSDVDIDVGVTGVTVTDIEKIQKLIPNGSKISGTKHPINYWINLNDKHVKMADAAYEIMTDKWVKKQSKERVKIPYNYLLEIAKFFIYGIEMRITEYESDMNELKYFKTILKDAKEDEQDEINTMIDMKEVEILADLDALEIVSHLIHGFRNEVYDKKHKFKYLIKIESESPNASVNNIIYKMLEGFGYLDKLKEYLKDREKLIED